MRSALLRLYESVADGSSYTYIYICAGAACSIFVRGVCCQFPTFLYNVSCTACVANFQLCTPTQTNPTPGLTLTLILTLILTLTFTRTVILRWARGRGGGHEASPLVLVAFFLKKKRRGAERHIFLTNQTRTLHK